MSGFASLAASSTDRVSGALSSAFTDLENGTWDSGSVGSTTASNSYSGVASTTDSSGYSGSITNYTPPDVSASESDVDEATYTEVNDTSIVDDSNAWNEYNQRLMRSLGQYVGCRVAGELDGTSVTGSYYGSGTWNVPGSLSDCTFNPGAWPAAIFESNSATMQVTAAPSNNRSADVSPMDRLGGQERDENAPAATGADNGNETEGSATTIWDMLGR